MDLGDSDRWRVKRAVGRADRGAYETCAIPAKVVRLVSASSGYDGCMGPGRFEPGDTDLGATFTLLDVRLAVIFFWSLWGETRRSFR